MFFSEERIMRKVVLCMAVMAVLAITSVAPAATSYCEWRGTAGDGLWTTGGNWSTGVAPNATDSGGVVGSPNYKAGFKQAAGASFSAGTMTTDILVLGGATGNTDLTLSGTATINVSEYITLAANTNDWGTLAMSGGTINTGVQYNNVTFYVTQKGTGILNMSGGTITVGQNYPTPAGTLGNFAMSSADLTGVSTMSMTGGNVYANNLVKGSGASVSLTIGGSGAFWLIGDRAGEIAGYVDDGWLHAGAGLEIATEYDDFANVTKVFATPEPATVCLLGLGVLGLIRRK
jgi:hypothetical protein